MIGLAICLWFLAFICVYVGQNEKISDGIKVGFYAIIVLIVVLYIVFVLII